MGNLKVLKNSFVWGVLGLCVTLGSCGNKKMPENISPIQTKIEGNLSNHFILVDQEYYLDEYSNNFKIELERTNEALPNFDRIGVGIEIFDKDGKSISLQKPKLEALTGFAGSFPMSLLQLNAGSYGNLNLNLADWPDKLYNAKTFKITIQTNADKLDQSQTSNKTSVNSDVNWDSTLDEFEKAINKLYTDMTNMSNLNAVENLQARLENNRDQLTQKQIARLNRLIKRID